VVHRGIGSRSPVWGVRDSGKDASYIIEERGARYELALTFDFALLQKVEVIAE
jgi:hypothetical protein